MADVTIYIVDDDAAVRDSLALLLRLNGYSSIAFASARDFLDALDPQRGGIALFDIRMPQMSGLELQKELLRRGVEMPIVFITGHGDVTQAVEAMKGGAVDFLEKPFEEERLLESVQSCLRRCEEREARVQQSAGITSRLETLTPRERQVLRLVSEGLTSKAIADRLGISARTVDIYRANIMDKMHARNAVDLVRMVLLAGEAALVE
ncbi:MAG: response regulator transcription factor [Alphaproteobacteria bacterium]|nr:response regulator transcription factor [Alphaproteobacteria bacterium]